MRWLHYYKIMLSFPLKYYRQEYNYWEIVILSHKYATIKDLVSCPINLFNECIHVNGKNIQFDDKRKTFVLKLCILERFMINILM